MAFAADDALHDMALACLRLLSSAGWTRRESMVPLCTVRLTAHGAPQARAARAAVKAMGEVEMHAWRGAHLDLDASTSHAIFLRDQNGNAYAFTVATLLELRHMHGIQIQR